MRGIKPNKLDLAGETAKLEKGDARASPFSYSVAEESANLAMLIASFSWSRYLTFTVLSVGSLPGTATLLDSLNLSCQ